MSGVAALVKNVSHFLKPVKEMVVMAPVVYYGLSKVQVVQKSKSLTVILFF